MTAAVTRARGIPTRTARAVVRDVLTATADELSAAFADLRVDVTIDGVHRARVTIRRARSALDLGNKVFAAGSVDSLRQELAWIMAALGEVRDADVMIRRLRSLEADDVLIAELESVRVEAAARVHVILRSRRSDDLLAMLRDCARHPPTVPQADDRAARRLRPILRKRWHKLAAAVDILGKHPTPEQLHHVRILAKRCRYTCEICEREFGAPAAKMARRLQSVQEELGALHDTGVLVARLRELAARDPALAFSAGQAAERALTRDHTDARRWRRAWHRVDQPKVLRWL